jgi:hypothetical protein
MSDKGAVSRSSTSCFYRTRHVPLRCDAGGVPVSGSESIMYPTLLAALLVTVTASNALAPADAGFALQTLGEFHGEDTVARDGEAWLALGVADDHAYLRPTRARVEPVPDPILDVGDERSGRRVSVGDAAIAPLALVRGPRLAPTESIRVAARDRVLTPGQALDLELSGQPSMRLQIECAFETALDTGVCHLIATQGERRQSLFEFAAQRQAGDVMLGDEGHVTLLFAGDLDGDGGLDLLLDQSDKYSVSHPTLLLSTPTESERLLEQVAMLTITAC